jgi:hypothetical protein
LIPYNPNDAVNTLPDGEYAATIEDVVPQISKKAQAQGETEPNMHVVTLKVYPQTGQPSRVWDYISYPKGTWKLEEVAVALGQAAAFKAGTFEIESFVGKNVRVYLRTKTDDYGSKNVVGEYLMAAPAKATGTDDSVPF